MATSDWDTTAGNNTSIGGINIAEGCPAGNLNDAIRELMAQVATGVDIAGDGNFANLTLDNPLPVTEGGTGAATAAAARTNLGLGTVAFHATNSAAQSVTSGAWATATFNTEQFDTSSNFASSAFTAPTTGLYMFGGGYLIDLTGSAPAAARVGFGLNGADPVNYARFISPVGATDLTTSLTFASIMPLSASDTVDMRVFFSTNGADLAGTNNTFFWGYRIA